MTVDAKNIVPMLFPLEKEEYLKKFNIVYGIDSEMGLVVAYGETIVFNFNEALRGTVMLFSDDPELQKKTDAAYDNLKNKSTVKFVTMAEALGMPEEAWDGMTYILTNAEAYNGASLILSLDVREMIHNVLGCDYYILPSSRHELIIMPQENAALSESDLREMVRSVNEREVDESDFLSNDIYICDGERIMICPEEKEMVS